MKKNMQTPFAIKAQRGISVVQIAVTILVGAILILGGLAAFRYITGASMNNEAGDIAQIITQIKSIKSTNADSLVSTNMDSQAELEAMGLIYQTQGGRVVAYLPDATNKVPVQVTIPNFNQDECREILPKINKGINYLKVGSTEATDEGEVKTKLPQLQQACVVGANSVIFKVS